MPNLIHRLLLKFGTNIAEYIQTKSPLEEYMSGRFSLILNLFAKSRVDAELQLTKAKQQQLQKFLEFLQLEINASHVEVVPPRIDSRASEVSEDLDDVVRTQNRLTGTPATRLYLTADARKKRLDRLELELLRNITKLDELRHTHAAGQSDGILKATNKAFNYVVHFYHRRAKYVKADWDYLPETSHPIVELIDFIGEYLAAFSYDRELARFSEDIHGHIIDSKYYMGSGAQYLSEEFSNQVFVSLDGAIKFLSITYTLLSIVTADDRYAPEIYAQIKLLIEDKPPYNKKVPLEEKYHVALKNILTHKGTDAPYYSSANLDLSLSINFIAREFATLRRTIYGNIKEPNKEAFAKFEKVFNSKLQSLLEKDLFVGFKCHSIVEMPKMDTKTHAELVQRIRSLTKDESDNDISPLDSPSSLQRPSSRNMFFAEQNAQASPLQVVSVRHANSEPNIKPVQALGRPGSAPVPGLL